jgi:hypothetical protein
MRFFEPENVVANSRILDREFSLFHTEIDPLTTEKLYKKNRTCPRSFLKLIVNEGA